MLAAAVRRRSDTAMRWFTVWLILTGVYLAIWAAVRGTAGNSVVPSREDIVHLAVIPVAQAGALAAVAAVRRRRGRDRRQGQQERRERRRQLAGRARRRSDA